jgi:hypothetical protein
MKSFNFGRIVLTLLMLISLGFYTKGQNITSKSTKPVFITGVTFDSKTHEPLSNANFKVNSKNTFTTNEFGRFSFFGLPNDTIVFTYLGYQPSRLVVPDTLKSEEYVMGVFMYEQAIKLAEIVILPRVPATSIIITPVKTDQKTMDIAQGHANDAAVIGLTQPTKTYDADLNTKKAIQSNQMRTEYKGMLVSPENSFGISTQSYRNNSIIYGSPITTPHRIAKEMVTNNESAILLEHFEAINRIIPRAEVASDSTIAK